MGLETTTCLPSFLRMPSFCLQCHDVGWHRSHFMDLSMSLPLSPDLHRSISPPNADPIPPHSSPSTHDMMQSQVALAWPRSQGRQTTRMLAKLPCETRPLGNADMNILPHTHNMHGATPRAPGIPTAPTHTTSGYMRPPQHVDGDVGGGSDLCICITTQSVHNDVNVHYQLHTSCNRVCMKRKGTKHIGNAYIYFFEHDVFFFRRIPDATGRRARGIATRKAKQSNQGTKPKPKPTPKKTISFSSQFRPAGAWGVPP